MDHDAAVHANDRSAEQDPADVAAGGSSSSSRSASLSTSEAEEAAVAAAGVDGKAEDADLDDSVPDMRIKPYFDDALLNVFGFAKEALSLASYEKPGGGRDVEAAVRRCYRAESKKWTKKCREAIVELVERSDIRFADHEVLNYEIGGKFVMHVDRDRGDGHLGTILFVVPSKMGGALVSETLRVDSCRPYLAYIPLGVKHAVEEVTDGQRWTLKAAVFEKPEPLSQHAQRHNEKLKALRKARYRKYKRYCKD